MLGTTVWLVNEVVVRAVTVLHLGGPILLHR